MNDEQAQAFLREQHRNIDRLANKIIGAFARIFGSLASRNEEIYWYRIQVTLGNTIGDGATDTVTITQEADFVATKIMQVTLDDTTGVIDADPSWEATLKDGSTDRELMNEPVHVSDLAGTAQRPLIAPKNRLFRRNSAIKSTWSQLKAPANPQLISLFFFGYKIFDEAALNLTVRR